MTDIDEIQGRLLTVADRKRQLALRKANEEIRAIERENAGYWDGVADMANAIKQALDAEREG